MFSTAGLRCNHAQVPVGGTEDEAPFKCATTTLLHVLWPGVLALHTAVPSSSRVSFREPSSPVQRIAMAPNIQHRKSSGYKEHLQISNRKKR